MFKYSTYCACTHRPISIDSACTVQIRECSSKGGKVTKTEAYCILALCPIAPLGNSEPDLVLGMVEGTLSESSPN